MSESPSVLVLTSSGSEPSVVTAILAALQAGGVNLRAYDGGHVGGEGSGAIDWVMRHLGGDVLEHQLAREIAEFRPDALLCFEPGAARAACELRNRSARPFPVIAAIRDLSPSASWSQSEVDRYFVVDDEAAVQLEDHGVPGYRILPVGCMGEYAYAEAGAFDRKTLRGKFKLSEKVVLVHVEGLGAEQSGQLALQLSLVNGDITYLFDAGDDTEAAAALRVQVPILDMKAKLFGRTEDAPLLWRCADVVITETHETSVGRALAVGAAVVCLSPAPGSQTHLANALEERGRGAIASNSLMVGGALERLLAAPPRSDSQAGLDGAAIVADATFLIGRQRQDVVEERRAAQSAGRKSEVEDASDYAAWAAKAATPAGALEDLGGGGGGAAQTGAPKRPDAARLRRLQREIKDRKAQVTRTIGDAQKETASWDKQRAKAESLGNEAMAKKAERNADLERARMHTALAEMAELEAEERSLEQAAQAAAAAPKAEPRRPEASAGRARQGSGTSVNSGAGSRPSVAEELERLRRAAEGSTAAKKPSGKSEKKTSRKARPKKGSAVDDELAALKRKMAQKRRG